MKYGRASRAAHVSRFLPRANISSPATTTLSFRISTFSRQSCFFSLPTRQSLLPGQHLAEAGSKWKTALRPKLVGDNILVLPKGRQSILVFYCT